MGKWHFWATVITASVFGLTGFLLGSNFPLPTPFTLIQSKVVFALAGVLLGLLTFARISSWVIRTSTTLAARAISRLASEIINQITRAASRGLPFLSLPSSRHEVIADPNRQNLGGALILDTSSIIDGRILDVAKTGFLSGLILVPNFVLTELQQVADSADSLKRARGRRGFEIINSLKKLSGLKIEVWDKELSGRMVDEKLIRLGKILHGKILTCDFNLNRVAKLQGVTVLNLNDLGNALKTLPVPGERLNIRITHQGKDDHQGVGYLTDGTMVVVKDASAMLGQDMTVEVTKILQGQAGRMVFAKLIHNS